MIVDEAGMSIIIEHDIGVMARYVCCDCGLAHDVVIKRDAQNRDKIWIRWWRNNHSTGQQRRHQKITVKDVPANKDSLEDVE